jgi:hypothetical protein
MTFPAHLLFPLASSVGYVIAGLLVKRSSAYGVGLWRTTFVSNLTMAICFSPLWRDRTAGRPALAAGGGGGSLLSGAGLHVLGDVG